MLKSYFSAAVLLLGLCSCGSSASGDKAGAAEADSTNQSEEKDMVSNEIPADTCDVTVEVETSLGSFTVLLYGDTPKHRDNFVKLAKEGFYDGTLFHRVINEFMVQAGDPDSKTAKPGQALGSGGPGYTIDAEILFPRHFHKRGALAAARQGDNVNPMKASSGSQFYVVTGKKVTDSEMAQLEAYMTNMALQNRFNELAQQHMSDIRSMQQKGDREGLQKLQEQLESEAREYAAAHPTTLTGEMKQAYKTVGGTPHLDNAYTVFGEVVKGMDVIDKIEKVETDRMDRPKEDVRIISMKVVE